MELATTIAAATGFRLRRVLVPHDLTAPSDRAFAWAAGLARANDAVVHLLHVLAVPAGSFVVDGTPFVWAATSLLDARDAAARRLAALRQRFAARARVHVVVGGAAAEIRDAAEQLGADLIVMALRGGAARRGGSAAATLDRAPCPVVLLREGAALPARAASHRPPKLH